MSIFVTSKIDSRSSDLSDSIFFAPKLDSQQALQGYIDHIRRLEGPENTYDRAITNKYPTYPMQQERLAPTPLGNLLSSFHVPVFSLQAGFRSAAADFFQIFVLVGLLAVLFLKNKRPFDLQYLLLCFSSILLLAIITILPQLSIEYGALRMFQQFLFLLALPIVIGLGSVLFFMQEQKRTIFIGIIVVILFLDLTGFISHLTGNYYPQMTLDNSGLYYDAYYVQESDVLAIHWLSMNNVKKKLVVTDSAGTNKLQTYGGINSVEENFPPLVPKDAYVYLEVSRNIIVSIENSTLIYNSDKPFLDSNKDLVYSNGDVNIYK